MYDHILFLCLQVTTADISLGNTEHNNELPEALESLHGPTSVKHNYSTQKMNQKRNQNFENTLLKQTLSILFCPEPVHVPFGIKSQHILFLCLQVTTADIRPQLKWAVNMVIADSHFKLPQEFVWVSMSKHTRFTVLFKMFSRWFFANKKLIITLRTWKFGDVT